jgi:hypothetical protein
VDCCIFLDGALADFIYYGTGILRPRENVTLYQKTVRGIALERCAQLCVNETTFHCSSFDFIYYSTSAVAPTGECKLSHYIAASVGGLVADTLQPLHSHYELAGIYLYMYMYMPSGG